MPVYWNRSESQRMILRRLFWTFTLRMLFGVVALLAMLLAFWTTHYHRMQANSAILNRISTHFGSSRGTIAVSQLAFRWSDPWVSNYGRITDALVSPENDDDLQIIVPMSGLNRLWIGSNRFHVTDRAIRHVVQLPQLDDLDINSAGITDSSLADLQKLPLKRLSLNCATITDDGLRHLVRVATLETLTLQCDQVTVKGLQHLSRLPKLQTLGIVYNPAIDNDVAATVSTFKSLRDLSLFQLTRSSPRLSPRACGQIARLPLSRLRLENISIGDDGLNELARCTTLTSLYLRNTDISDQGVEVLWRLTSLTELSIINCPISDRGMPGIAKCDSLTYLSLCGTGISDEGLNVLRSLRSLTELDVLDTYVTEGAIRWLRCEKRTLTVFGPMGRFSDEPEIKY